MSKNVAKLKTSIYCNHTSDEEFNVSSLDSICSTESELGVVLSVIEIDVCSDASRTRVILILDDCCEGETQLCAMHVRNGVCTKSGCLFLHSLSFSQFHPATFINSGTLSYGNLASTDLESVSRQLLPLNLSAIRFILFDKAVIWDHEDYRIWTWFKTQLKHNLFSDLSLNGNHLASSLEIYLMRFPIECVKQTLSCLTLREISTILSLSSQLYRGIKSNSALFDEILQRDLFKLFDESVNSKMLDSYSIVSLADVGIGHILLNNDDSYTGSCVLQHRDLSMTFDESVDFFNVSGLLLTLIDEKKHKHASPHTHQTVKNKSARKRNINGRKSGGDEDSDSSSSSSSSSSTRRRKCKRADKPKEVDIDALKPSGIIWSIGHRSVPIQVLFDVSSENHLAVSVGECGDVRLWDKQNGAKLATTEAGREGRLVEVRDYDMAASLALKVSPSRPTRRNRSSWPASQCPTVLSVACGRKYVYVGLEKLLSVVDRDDFSNVMQLKDPWFRDGVISLVVMTLPVDRDYLARKRRSIDLTREVVLVMTSTPAIVILDCQTQSILLQKTLHISSSHFFPIPSINHYSSSKPSDFGALIFSWRSNMLSSISLVCVEDLIRDVDCLIDSKQWEMCEGIDFSCSEWTKIAKSLSSSSSSSNEMTRIPPTTSSMEQTASSDYGCVRLITTSLVPADNIFYLWNLNYAVNQLVCTQYIDATGLIMKLDRICSGNRLSALDVLPIAAGDGEYKNQTNLNVIELPSIFRQRSVSSEVLSCSRTCISRCVTKVVRNDQLLNFSVWKLSCIGRQNVLVVQYPYLGFLLFHSVSLTPLSIIINSTVSDSIRVQSFTNLSSVECLDDEFIFQRDCDIALVKTGRRHKERASIDPHSDSCYQSMAGSRRRSL